MEPKIVDLPKLYFIGLKAELTMREINQVCPALWSELMSKSQDLFSNQDLMCLGVCITPETSTENDSFIYMAGFASDKPLEGRKGYVLHEISASKYAVFTHKGSINTLTSTFDYAYKTWVPASHYKVHCHEDLELYDQRFNESDPENSEMDIYIPIQ